MYVYGQLSAIKDLYYIFAINLQIAIRILKNHAFRTCAAPSRTFRPILRSIGLLDIEIPQKETISTDGQTDVAYAYNNYQQDVEGSFFERGKNY